ncbi:indolepyruvate ferredoxin oxidoreductase family protein [Pollutimonas harenae]|uniref:Indolepyruvate ferredoxin oxidoreductase family protein n=1 Tax=Pollutimonas harenae TaxID=657015 RepID=A0A853GYE5_9BURK|nr:indolepyruvate ferredoxin oxidoreductase family protein [Pollutimonas harenae]NYT84075.1 indolepyruvate ferredoxin oxidoreductase family protein [Pollutimonas harenae]TEA73500.1 indolepyruvate ferredoxin oxidoreductase family protein [Pollutimonas harenae]
MAAPQIDYEYKLDDNLTATTGRVFLTGTQALVRLVLAQRRVDQARGLNTAGFVTGYRGSPLGGVDLAMWRAQSHLDEHQISFLPSINEDLGATMIMGTQQAGVREDRQVDGVFAMWYGKGPGVDRAGDAIHHGHAAGASRHGGVLMIVGDDHTAASSSIPHASESSLKAWGIPIVHPASVEEYEAFGLWGWALSRYSGAWVALKAVTETVESGRSFTLEAAPSLPAPDDKHDSLEYSAREFLTPAIEHRMTERLQAVKSFASRHPLDRLVDPAPGARLGIVTTGKAFLDTQDALQLLGHQHPHATLPALRHYKVGLSWPMDEAGFLQFAQGLDHILVIEEKAPFIEGQIKDMLYNQAQHPTVMGKLDLDRQVLIPQEGQLCPSLLVTALRSWLQQAAALVLNDESPSDIGSPAASAPLISTHLTRRPYFCSGCPHSTSTKVPEGSQALAGVGCHYMATWMDRATSGLTQMGGEGADWIGLSRYTRTPHIFQNMGEGTYFHSGYLAIRQAVAAQVNITYKILFNDAVAMTGGQPVDGSLSVPQICQQMLGEGVKRVAITSDDPGKYRGIPLAAGVTVHDRHELDALQRELREVKGVTVLIHDQACAAEKRRRRKKKTLADPARRLFINAEVCEGCGDCSTQSNCLSLTPVETPFGRKRAIDQSSCNKDYSCVDGFCPSFVSVIGGTPRKASHTSPADHERLQALITKLPLPDVQPRGNACNVLVAGIGGTGIITIGAILSMAAHLEGRAASVLDITGLAQKGGAVISHIRLSSDTRPTGAVRIGLQQADVAILCDPVAASKPEVLQTLRHAHTLSIINTYLAPTPEFTQDPQANLDPQELVSLLRNAVGDRHSKLLQAHAMANKQFGDSIMSNMLMLGFAWQCGAIPLSLEAIMHALELNNVAIQANQRAFQLGRLVAVDPAALEPASHTREQAVIIHAPETLDQVLTRCRTQLTTYQNAAYAQQYSELVDQVLAAEKALRPQGRPRLTIAVAQGLHKLMAYKDEYEVARLFTSGTFRQSLHDQFEGEFSLRFHLAPPILARRDPHTGIPRKLSLGPATEKVFGLLAYGKILRGSWLDIFSYTSERKLERRLIDEYRAAVLNMLARLDASNYDLALELAELPLMVRGFGHVKMASIKPYRNRLALLQSRLGAPTISVNNFSRFPVWPDKKRGEARPAGH